MSQRPEAGATPGPLLGPSLSTVHIVHGIPHAPALVIQMYWDYFPVVSSPVSHPKSCGRLADSLI